MRLGNWIGYKIVCAQRLEVHCLRKEVEGTVGEHATGLNTGSDAYLSKQAFHACILWMVKILSKSPPIDKRMSAVTVTNAEKNKGLVDSPAPANKSRLF